MMSQFATGLFQELLKCDAAIRKPSLQRSRAEIQLSRHVVNRRPLPCEQAFNGELDLVSQGLARLTFIQLRRKLRRNRRQQIGVVRYKWPIQVARAQNERITTGFELSSATEV